MKLLIEFFYKWEKEIPNKTFMRQPYGNSYKDISWKEAGEQIRKMANYIIQLNLPEKSNIGILSKNCYHWVLADLAIQMAKHISVPFYPNLSKQQLEEVVELGNIELVFVGKLDNLAEEVISSDISVVKFPHYPNNYEVQKGENWDEIIKTTEAITENPLPNKDNLWTILFTSGTTGSPKGVMITHQAFAHLLNAEVKHNHLGILKLKHPRFFSFLPMNHIAERMAVESGCLMSGGTIYFAESIDTFAKNLQDAQPNLFLAVPRIWSKFHLAILGKISDSKINTILKIPILGNFFKNKIRKGLGLHQAKVVLTGAAPTPESLKNWYKKFDIELQEVYGLSETCGGCVLMPKNVVKENSTGKVLAGVDLKIDEKTNEILIKMPWMMSGYYNNEEKTNQVLKDGWLHSGDSGYLDQEGFLFITGRVSDTFKSAKGKYIVPNKLENYFTSNELIEQICVVGRGIPQPIALCQLSEIGKKANKEKLTESVLSDLNNCNSEQANYNKISTVVLVQEDWTTDNNILTPTMKVRRNSVNKKYENDYLKWHDSEEVVIWE